MVLSRAQGNLRLLMYIGLFTGLRLGDVVNLRWENIEFDPWTREVRPGLIVVKPLKTQRRDKKVEIPIHANLTKLLQARRCTSDCVLVSEGASRLEGSRDQRHTTYSGPVRGVRNPNH